MIWAAIGVTALFGLLGCLELVMCIRYACDSADFEDWVLVVIVGIGALFTLGFAALPWVLGAGAS